MWEILLYTLGGGGMFILGSYFIYDAIDTGYSKIKLGNSLKIIIGIQCICISILVITFINNI